MPLREVVICNNQIVHPPAPAMDGKGSSTFAGGMSTSFMVKSSDFHSCVLAALRKRCRCLNAQCIARVAHTHHTRHACNAHDMVSGTTAAA